MRLRLISTTAMKTVIDQSVEIFSEREHLAIDRIYTPSAQILQRIRGGDPFDLIVATDATLDALQRSGLVEGVTSLACSCLGVAVSPDAPPGDVSSVGGFRKALLSARAIAMSNPVGGGVSGGHVAKVFTRLGLDDALAPKLRYSPGGPHGLVGAMILRGEADLGIQQMPELLAVPGTRLLGPLPEELQLISRFGIARGCASPCPTLADAFIADLGGPNVRALMRSLGWLDA